MPASLPFSREAEAARLAASRAAMAAVREATYHGRGVMAAVLAAGGVGDWEHAPRPARSVALACRLCPNEPSRAAFRSLVLHVQAHAGRLLHRRPSPDHPGLILCLQQLAARHDTWRRPPEGWRPRTTNAAGQLAQLAGYLLP